MEMEWVSVRDRMPRYGQAVIICLSNNVVQERTFYRFSYEENNGKDLWQCCVEDDAPSLPINEGDHWMPLPPPVICL